jgi:hypothetical protein
VPPRAGVIVASRSRSCEAVSFLTARPPQRDLARFGANDGGNWASTRNRLSPAEDDRVVEVLGRVLEAGADIFAFQVRVVGQDLIF